MVPISMADMKEFGWNLLPIIANVQDFAKQNRQMSYGQLGSQLAKHNWLHKHRYYLSYMY